MCFSSRVRVHYCANMLNLWQIPEKASGEDPERILLFKKNQEINQELWLFLRERRVKSVAEKLSKCLQRHPPHVWWFMCWGNSACYQPSLEATTWSRHIDHPFWKKKMDWGFGVTWTSKGGNVCSAGHWFKVNCKKIYHHNTRWWKGR